MGEFPIKTLAEVREKLLIVFAAALWVVLAICCDVGQLFSKLNRQPST
jgi:hypothetical protein